MSLFWSFQLELSSRCYFTKESKSCFSLILLKNWTFLFLLCSKDWFVFFTPCHRTHFWGQFIRQSQKNLFRKYFFKLFSSGSRDLVTNLISLVAATCSSLRPSRHTSSSRCVKSSMRNNMILPGSVRRTFDWNKEHKSCIIPITLFHQMSFLVFSLGPWAKRCYSKALKEN